MRSLQLAVLLILAGALQGCAFSGWMEQTDLIRAGDVLYSVDEAWLDASGRLEVLVMAGLGPTGLRSPYQLSVPAATLEAALAGPANTATEMLQHELPRSCIRARAGRLADVPSVIRTPLAVRHPEVTSRGDIVRAALVPAYDNPLTVYGIGATDGWIAGCGRLVIAVSRRDLESNAVHFASFGLAAQDALNGSPK